MSLGNTPHPAIADVLPLAEIDGEQFAEEFIRQLWATENASNDGHQRCAPVVRACQAMISESIGDGSGAQASMTLLAEAEEQAKANGQELSQ